MVDAGARNPLTIDPLLGGTADTLRGSDQGSVNLDWNLSGAGNVNGDGSDADQQIEEGAAFVFLPEPGAIVLLANGVAVLAWRVRVERALR